MDSYVLTEEEESQMNKELGMHSKHYSPLELKHIQSKHTAQDCRRRQLLLPDLTFVPFILPYMPADITFVS